MTKAFSGINPEFDGLTNAISKKWVFANWEIVQPMLSTCDTIVLFDVDSLICFNDKFGMIITDGELKRVANALINEFKNELGPIRFGGDEFFVALDSRNYAISNLPSLLDRLSNKTLAIQVDYSNISHFSVSAAVTTVYSGIKTINELNEIIKFLIDEITSSKEHISNRKYSKQMAFTHAIYRKSEFNENNQIKK